MTDEPNSDRIHQAADLHQTNPQTAPPHAANPYTTNPQTANPQTANPQTANPAQHREFVRKTRYGFRPPANPSPGPSPAPSPASSLDSFSDATAGSTAAPSLEHAPSASHIPNPGAAPGTDLSPSFGQPLNLPKPAPRIWQKQPYAAITHLLAMGGTLTAGWFLGLLAAQILPGNIQTPPLQESTLRKASRLTSRLWHFNQLWQSPTTELQIEAVPLPSTAPVTQPVSLTPIERQPLIDELNSIETEILTLERRIETLEQRLGNPLYEGADINTRLNTLRRAIDPPVRPALEPSAHQPTPVDPADRLLAVAQLRITLPSDALFAPGQSSLKDDAILDQVMDQLVNYPGSTVIVRSYSDNQADVITTRDYTLAQANAIATYLQSALPTAHRWVTIGNGQAQPVTTNDTPIDRQRNRRIEFLVDTR